MMKEIFQETDMYSDDTISVELDEKENTISIDSEGFQETTSITLNKEKALQLATSIIAALNENEQNIRDEIQRKLEVKKENKKYGLFGGAEE